MNTHLQFTHSYLQGPVKVEQKSNEEADSLYSVPLPISPWVSEPMPQGCYRPSFPLYGISKYWLFYSLNIFQMVTVHHELCLMVGIEKKNCHRGNNLRCDMNNPINRSWVRWEPNRQLSYLTSVLFILSAEHPYVHSRISLPSSFSYF